LVAVGLLEVLVVEPLDDVEDGDVGVVADPDDDADPEEVTGEPGEPTTIETVEPFGRLAPLPGDCDTTDPTRPGWVTARNVRST
jgi:hypothetical protein